MDAMAANIDADGRAGSGVGEFFCVDRRAFMLAATLGLPAATVFLTISRGCGRPNRKSMWGNSKIEAVTGLRWARSNDELRRLIAHGLIERTNEDKPRAPGMYLVPNWSDAATGEILEPDFIYLPNVFVDGTVSGETPPLRLLRETGSLDALRSAVLLYAEQRLTEFGGLSFRTTLDGEAAAFTRYQSERTYSAGAHTVTAFRPGNFTSSWVLIERLGFEHTQKGGEQFWQAIQSLQAVGLLTTTPYLVDSLDGEALHAIDPTAGEDIEMRIAAASCLAAESLLPDGMAAGLRRDGHLLAVVPRHMTNATCVGIFRMRYRARTAMNSRWLAQLNSDFDRWSEHYRALTL